MRYFLYEYETALATEQGGSPIVQWDEVNNHDLQDTIEHILPQSISDQPYWQKRFTEEQHSQYVHDLGNLTLTTHNSTYQNKPFPEKKGSVTAQEHCYAKSALFVEKELEQWDTWEALTIDERRGRLLEWAQKRWAIDYSEAGDTNGDAEMEEPSGEMDDDNLQVDYEGVTQ